MTCRGGRLRRRRQLRNVGTSSPALWEGMQQTFSVLHTLRSSEFVTLDENRSASAPSPATIQAPPVPWALTGVPAWRATAPSWATAAPEPRATARLMRGSANKAQPAARDREPTSVRVPAGRPLAASAGATACSTIARAVPSASEPMRITTLLPLRTTPAASAKTLGRPSNTKATTPTGARRASTLHPSWAILSTVVSRRTGDRSQPRRPAIMSSSIPGDNVRRVVERPASVAAATSRSFAMRIGPTDRSSLNRSAKEAKNVEI